MSFKMDTSPMKALTIEVTEDQRNKFKSCCSIDGQSVKDVIGEFVLMVSKYGAMKVLNHLRLLNQKGGKGNG